MRKIWVLVLLVALGVGACGGSALDTAAACSDLSDVDVSALSAEEAERMGDLVFGFAETALESGDTQDFFECQELVQPLDEVGVILDLVEMDRS